MTKTILLGCFTAALIAAPALAQTDTGMSSNTMSASKPMAKNAHAKHKAAKSSSAMSSKTAMGSGMGDSSRAAAPSNSMTANSN